MPHPARPVGLVWLWGSYVLLHFPVNFLSDTAAVPLAPPGHALPRPRLRPPATPAERGPGPALLPSGPREHHSPNAHPVAGEKLRDINPNGPLDPAAGARRRHTPAEGRGLPGELNEGSAGARRQTGGEAGVVSGDVAT